jgi:FAD synthase
VEFIEFVRPDAKFASIEALQEQMAQDTARAREILAAAPAAPLPASP